MSSAVLDASALLALLREEAGAEVVAAIVGNSLMSAVNLAEVAAHFAFRGMPEDAVATMLRPLPMTIVAADHALALKAGALRAVTADRGLSLGDRFCLALAVREGLPAFTADRQWQTIAAAASVEVRLIR
jgi:PIN domain nuclease of toxin-antitoxin system